MCHWPKGKPTRREFVAGAGETSVDGFAWGERECCGRTKTAGPFASVATGLGTKRGSR